MQQAPHADKAPGENIFENRPALSFGSGGSFQLRRKGQFFNLLFFSPLPMSAHAKKKRGHGDFVFAGKGAADFRAVGRFRGGELRSIDMSSNRIQRMLGLEAHHALVSLDLSHNSIGAIEGLDGLTRLQALRLHHNHLTRCGGVEALCQLQVLDLNNNDLTSIAELRHCTALTELDVSCNALAELDDISSLRRLAALSLRGNLLKLLDRLPHCLPPSLRTLDLARNSIGDVSELQNLAAMHSLVEVDVSENVFAATAAQRGFSYRPLAVAIAPALQALDGEAVTRAERSTAEQLFSGDGRRNRSLLEVGQEPALLSFLAEHCPANLGGAGAPGVGDAPPVGGMEPPPTAAQFAELEQQVREMRRYFKQYVKNEARKRDRATRVLQACILGHSVRKEYSGRLRPRVREVFDDSSRQRDHGRPSTTSRSEQIQLPPPKCSYHHSDAGSGAGSRRGRVSAQGFDASRYQLVQPSSPRRGGTVDSDSGYAVGDAQQQRAAQKIQARGRGLIARKRLADIQECKESAVRIQSAYRGMAGRRRMGMTWRPMYGQPRNRRPGGSSGGGGSSRSVPQNGGFAGLADVSAELAALQSWRAAQEEAMRYLWEEVRQLRVWKDARLESESLLQDTASHGGATGTAQMARDLASVRTELAQLKSRLALSERSLPGPARAVGHGQAVDEGDLASHILNTYRLGDREAEAG